MSIATYHTPISYLVSIRWNEAKNHLRIDSGPSADDEPQMIAQWHGVSKQDAGRILENHLDVILNTPDLVEKALKDLLLA